MNSLLFLVLSGNGTYHFEVVHARIACGLGWLIHGRSLGSTYVVFDADTRNVRYDRLAG